MRYLAIGLVACFSTLALDAATAEACSAASTCSRYVACMSGATKVSAGTNRYYCKRATSTTLKTPTCSRANMANDWRWNSSKRYCQRSKSNGTVITNRDNISCSSGYSYTPSLGKCRRAGGTAYTAPSMSTSPTGGSVMPMSSASSASRTVRCPSGYSLGKLGTKYYCAAWAKTSQTPTCGPLNMRSDWRWSSSARKCYRYKTRSSKAWSTANIKCRTGYSYKSSTGMCEPYGLTQTPTCGRLNMRSDWRWSSSVRKCYRYKSRTTKAWSSANINCNAGYIYQSSTGKCAKSSSNNYQLPTL